MLQFLPFLIFLMVLMFVFFIFVFMLVGVYKKKTHVTLFRSEQKIDVNQTNKAETVGL